jgi:hypothetical protein
VISSFRETAISLLKKPLILQKLGTLLAAGSAGSGAAAAAVALVSLTDKTDDAINYTNVRTTDIFNIAKNEVVTVSTTRLLFEPNNSVISESVSETNLRLLFDLLGSTSSLMNNQSKGEDEPGVPHYVPWLGAASAVFMTLGVVVSIRSCCSCAGKYDI